MDKRIIYRDESKGDVCICREMCDRLMQHQASMASTKAHREILGSMRFENRLLPSFNSAPEKQLIVAYDRGLPVGYVFSTAELVTDESRDERPVWALKAPGQTRWLYPDGMETPVKIGDLNNLYVLPEYRGLGLGQELAGLAMSWLRSIPEARWLFVYVADGNPVAPFYERYGFRFSHSVLGGLIDAYIQEGAGRA